MCEHIERSLQKVAIYVMSSRDTKIKRTLLESGLGLLAKEYEKNPSYGHKSVHDNMVPWALRALGTKMLSQSVEYSMHCINCAKREREKLLLF